MYLACTLEKSNAFQNKIYFGLLKICNLYQLSIIPLCECFTSNKQVTHFYSSPDIFSVKSF